MEWVLQYGWIIWLALILIFVTIEILSLEFTFLMLAAGSILGLVSGLFGVPWWGQLLIAAGSAVLLLLLVRPPLLRALRSGGDEAKSNIDALIGLSGRVVLTVNDHSGQVRLANGETWTARATAGSTGDLEPDQSVTVYAIVGATAIVAAKKENSYE